MSRRRTPVSLTTDQLGIIVNALDCYIERVGSHEGERELLEELDDLYNIAQELEPIGVDAAQEALLDLKSAMSTISQPTPAYKPGKEPTAADHCAQVLELMDALLKQLAVYLKVEGVL